MKSSSQIHVAYESMTIVSINRNEVNGHVEIATCWSKEMLKMKRWDKSSNEMKMHSSHGVVEIDQYQELYFG